MANEFIDHFPDDEEEAAFLRRFTSRWAREYEALPKQQIGAAIKIRCSYAPQLPRDVKA